ncbi:MAG TPA: tRNA-guanine transglycosylase, partial [Sedimentisphaerales bacterium]|nr:tRNA-guanine transglycosylase [Sedimentisphaerales bacterium]
ARRKRLYIIDISAVSRRSRDDWFDILYMHDDKHRRSTAAIDENCDCRCCRQYSRGYLHHLARADEACFDRLATIHNIRSMVRLTERLRDL